MERVSVIVKGDRIEVRRPRRITNFKELLSAMQEIREAIRPTPGFAQGGYTKPGIKIEVSEMDILRPGERLIPTKSRFIDLSK